MKKLLFTFLPVFLCLAILLSACGPPAAKSEEPKPEEKTAETQEFTDSLGRTVTLPAEITKVAVSGPLAQTYLVPLCADLFVGFSIDYAPEAQKFFPAEFWELPHLGQLYGGKGTMDLEALLKAAPDVVIDLGEQKQDMAKDFDDLSEQTGIPFIHIDATVETAGEAYKILGELLGKQEQAEKLAAYCENILEKSATLMEKIDKAGERVTAAYLLGDKGLNAIAKGSFHGETFDFMTENVVVVEQVVSKGSGNEIDMEQLLLWDPEVVVFAHDSIYDTVKDSPEWQKISAVKEGKYAKVPFGPLGWLSSPPSVQRYLGFIWLAELLYPEESELDFKQEVKDYYRLFYGYDLSDEELNELTKDSFFKAP